MKTVFHLLLVFTLNVALSHAGIKDVFESNPQKRYKNKVEDSLTTKLKLSQLTVLGDNDTAFKAKLDAIDSATESIDMIYYIYSNDESSDYFSMKLLQAAARGVKVRILLDYHSTYKNLDMFTAMEQASNGNIQVRLFNRPTEEILKDAFYMTISCKDLPLKDCPQYKREEISKIYAKDSLPGNISNLNNGASGLLLSGIYGKDGDMIIEAILSGQDIDLDAFTSGDNAPSEQEKEDLKELLKLYYDSKVGSSTDKIAAKAKLAFAKIVYGEDVTKILNTLNSYGPFGNQNSDLREKDWHHFTDYTHHKLLLVDSKKIVLGGRNIENSYHMKPNELTEKYIFMDTDISAEMTRGGSKVKRSFEKLWNFQQMVATTNEVRTHAPNDLLMHKKIFEKQCENAEKKMDCYKDFYQNSYVTLAQREQSEIEQIYQGAQDYLEQYQVALAAHPWERNFSIENPEKLFIGYLENLPFKKDRSGNLERQYGATEWLGREGKSNKNIQQVWRDAILHTCKMASKENPQRIIFHNAYVFPAGNMMQLFSNIVDGSTSCANVEITILTNSDHTTDLRIVNQLARYQMKAFYDYYAKYRHQGKGATFRYYEYLAPEIATEGQYSLHSKVSLIGDTVIIGSANLDIRSYMMDTNNALFIKGANDFIREYTQFIDSVLTDSQLSRRIDGQFIHFSLKQLQKIDDEIIEEYNEKYNIDKRINPKTYSDIKQRLLKSMKTIYDTVDDIFNSEKEPQKAYKVDKLNQRFKLI